MQPQRQRGRPAKPIKESTWKVAPTEMPPTPDDMSGEALAEWNRLGPILVALNRVSKIDAEPLRNYCLYWGRFAAIMRQHFYDDDADLLADGPTCQVIHPMLPELIGYARELLRIAAEFGLTARSRDLDGDNPRKIPSMLKRLYGNRRKVAESKIPDSVVPMLPDWDESDLRPPLWMTTEAVEIYEKVGEELKNLDLFTPLDKIHICCLACLAELTHRANSQLDYDFVPVVSKMTGETTYEKANPLHKAIKELGKISAEYWTAYGMTPRARKIFNNEQPEQAKSRPVIFKGKFA